MQARGVQASSWWAVALGGVVGPVIGGVDHHVGQAAVFGIAALLSLAPFVVFVTMRPAVARTRAA